MRLLMSNPNNVYRVVDGVVSMLAGDVFENSRVRRRLFFFKCLYAIASLLTWREGSAARGRRRLAINQSLQGLE